MKLAYTEYNNIDKFRLEYIELLENGLLNYEFVHNFRNDFIAMMEEDLGNYKKSKNYSEKVPLLEIIIEKAKKQVNFKEDFNNFLRKLDEIIEKDISHSLLMSNFFGMVDDIISQYNLR